MQHCLLWQSLYHWRGACFYQPWKPWILRPFSFYNMPSPTAQCPRCNSVIWIGQLIINCSEEKNWREYYRNLLSSDTSTSAQKIVNFFVILCCRRSNDVKTGSNITKIIPKVSMEFIEYCVQNVDSIFWFHSESAFSKKVLC